MTDQDDPACAENAQTDPPVVSECGTCGEAEDWPGHFNLMLRDMVNARDGLVVS